jgi:hypothetical protein
MADSILTRVKRHAWKQAFGETSWILRAGDFRTKEQHGLIGRANYAYGMLRAADCAKYFGFDKVTVIEFGVASGTGLLNMVELAELIQQETGVSLRIFGFDTGAGLPQVQGYKDHPEIWNPGDFTMEDPAALEKRLNGRAQIVWGDIAQTIGPFMSGMKADAPIGFISVDVDIYSGTKSALKVLQGRTDRYIPAVSMYFDDISFYFANRWAGELAAIEEFNEQNVLRKIDHDRSLKSGRRPGPLRGWYESMYACHILDHPARQSSLARPKLTIKEHADFMSTRALF